MKTKTINLNKANSIKAIKEIASNLGLLFINKTDNILQFEKTGNLLTYGNVIIVKIQTVSNGKQKVSISSNSKSDLQIIDWSTNGGIEKDFIEMLKEYIKK